MSFYVLIGNYLTFKQMSFTLCPQMFQSCEFFCFFVLDSDTGCSITREQKDMCLGLLRRRNIDSQGSSLAMKFSWAVFHRLAGESKSLLSPAYLYIYTHTYLIHTYMYIGIYSLSLSLSLLSLVSASSLPRANPGPISPFTSKSISLATSINHP